MNLDHFVMREEKSSYPFAIRDIHDADRIYEPPERVPEVSPQPLNKSSVIDPSADQNNNTGSSELALYESSVDDHFVDTLDELADPVVATIDAELPQSLRGDIRDWLELHGRNPESENAKRLLARQAIFALLLKVTVYEWYQQDGCLPPLPADTRAALRDAGDRTDNPVFDEFVLDAVVWETYESAPDAVIAERDRLLTSSQPAEDIGELYAHLIESDNRKTLGQFRTPPTIAQTVDMLAGDDTDSDTILDVGIGAGVLSTPFHPELTFETDPNHVLGIDKSPLAALQANAALTLSGQSHTVSVADFLTSDPEAIQPDYHSIRGNLPFTSARDLPDNYKEQINDEIEKRVNEQTEPTTELTISAKSPLYAYCLYHSRQFLSPGNRATFITPHSFFATEYGNALKQFLLEEFDLKAVVEFDPEDESVFDDADTTAVILVLEATTADDPSSTTRFIRVDDRVSARTIYSAVQHGQTGDRIWGRINCVEQSELSSEGNWEALFAPVGVDTSQLSPLSDFVTVNCGKATGKVDLFCLSQDEIEREGINRDYLTRLIRKPELVEGYDFQYQDWKALQNDGEPVWLLDPGELAVVPASIESFSQQVADESVTLQKSNLSDDERNVLKYLQKKVEEYDLDETNDTLNNRRVWYCPPQQDPARVLVDFADREEFRFLLNQTDARYINNFYGFYEITLSETELKALLAYLHSGFLDSIVRQNKQTIQSGYKKMSVSDVEQLPVIDPTDLPDEVVADLADAFDTLRATARAGDDCAPVRDRIDELLSSGELESYEI